MTTSAGTPPHLLSLVLPCHNEEGNVDLWNADLFPVMEQLSFPIQYVVIDDASTDGTWAKIQTLAAVRSNVTVLRHTWNRGLGAALRTGLAAAQGDVVVTLDADLTFSPKLIPAMLAAYEPGVDCVCASPFLGQFEGVGRVRWLLSAGVNGIYRCLMGKPLTAVSSLGRLYRADVVKALPLESESFDINSEIIFALLKRKAGIVEIPALLSVRKFGESKISVAREIKNHVKMFLRILLWRIVDR